MTRLALVFILGVLLAGSVVSNFGLDAVARFLAAINPSQQSQAQPRGSEASGLGRVAQLLGGGAEGEAGVGVRHALTIAQAPGGTATAISYQREVTR